MSDSKTAADVTDTPKGLDVVVTEPRTIVGSKDLQGTDGETRTDRPGEILGTPIANDRIAAGRDRAAARADYQTSEVDRANREELPRLGGTIDDGWEAGEAAAIDTRGTAAGTRSADAAAGTRATEAAPVGRASRAPAKSSSSADSGISVSPKTDRG